VLFFLILGIISGEYLPFNLLILFLLLSLILLIPTRFYSLYLLFSLIFALNEKLSQPHLPKRFFYQKVSLKGEMSEEGIIKIKSVTIGNQEIKIGGKVKVFFKGNVFPRIGDLVKLEGVLKPIDYPSNPNLFNHNRYFKRKGFVGNLLAEKIETIQPGKPSLIRHLLTSFHNYSRETFSRGLGEKERAVLFGLLFGEKRGLPPDVRCYFSRSGLYHILAVSGLHIGILVFALLIFLSVVRLNQLGKALFITIFLLFYLAVVGFSPSATRATIMALLLLYSYLLQRKTDPFHSLVIAAILILFFSPGSLFEPGFQLSFIITAFILLFGLPLYRRLKKIKVKFFSYLFSSLSVSFSAFLGGFPLIWFHFYQIPVLTIFANLFVIPLVGFLLPLAFFLLGINLLLPSLAGFLSLTLNSGLKALLFLIRFFGAQPFATINLPKPPQLFLFWLYLLFLLLLRWKEKRIRTIWLILFFAGANLFLWSSLIKREEIQITFLDTYSSEPVLIENQNRSFLILTGKWEGILDDFLASKGIKELDILFLPKIKERDLKNLEGKLNSVKIKSIFIPGVSNFPFARKGEAIRVGKNLLVEYLGMRFLLFPKKGSYNLLLMVNDYRILFYFAGEILERVEIIRISGGRKRLREMVFKEGEYLIYQTRKGVLPFSTPFLLPTRSFGAITIKLGAEVRIITEKGSVYSGKTLPRTSL